jgi:chitinase
VNVHSNKCIDVAYAATNDGARVQLHDCNSSVAQSFRIMDEGGAVVFVNPNSNKCLDVDGRGTANGTKVHLWTCNGTVAQRWTAKPLTTPPPPPPPPDPGLPAKVVAAYYPNWATSAIRVRDIPANYNVIYLFSARPEGESPGTTGAVLWDAPGNGRGAAANLNADIQYARTVQKRKVILSIGGQGGGMSFPNRAKSQRFVDSVVGLYNQFGGIDGIDWNTFEADQAPDTAEMIWMSLELKRRYPGFLVTAPPAPWNNLDKDFCVAMASAGALDYAAPQYYDGPGLAAPSYIINSVDEWVRLLGPTKVVVGFGIWNQANYSSVGQVVEAWNEVERRHPSVRGGFDWSIILDEQQGWPFANTVGPLILQ